MLRSPSEKKDRHWLKMSVHASEQSKDPSTRVGSFILGPDYEVRSSGYNGFPRGVKDDHRLQDRETKLNLVVHAELNALLAAARVGTPLKGCTLFLAATDDSGMVWGGPPCTRCSVHIIQSGIDEIVSYKPKAVPSRWAADLAVARGILDEAGILYREYAPLVLDEGRRVYNYAATINYSSSEFHCKFYDLEDCIAFGHDEAGAMAACCRAAATWVLQAIASGRSVPEARTPEQLLQNAEFAYKARRGAVLVVTIHIETDGKVGAFVASKDASTPPLARWP